MRISKLILAAIVATGAMASQMVRADQCTTSGCGLNVNFSMNIPSVFRFTLGAAGSVPTVTWGAGTITAANLGTTTNIPSDTVTNGGAGSNNTTQVRYALLSNLAGGTSVSIAASAGNLTSGGNTIPLTEIVSTTTAQTGSGIAMPAAGGNTGALPYPGSGVFNEVGYWNYAFDNQNIYAAGTYTGSITYTATSSP